MKAEEEETKEELSKRILADRLPLDNAAAETMTLFTENVLLYLFSIFWNWLFLRKGTNTFEWIIYFIGGIILFVITIKLFVAFFRKLIITIKLSGGLVAFFRKLITFVKLLFIKPLRSK